MIKPTLILLDGNALLHRAWHAIPPLTTADGQVVHAVYGFAMVVEKLLEQYKPACMGIAWDLPGKTFRHTLYEAYKATRERKEQELYDQIPLIKELMKKFHITNMEAPGFEADDVIGTLSAMGVKEGFHVLIVTGDLDSLQLVDENTHVVFFQRGISETKLYDIQAVKDRYGFLPHQLVDYKALRGDPSDNIPGVKGIGEKTATELIIAHHDMKGILNAFYTGHLAPKVAKKFIDQDQVIKKSLTLVEIVRTIPLEFDFTSSPKPDWTEILEQYQKFEFKSLLRKHQSYHAPSSLTTPLVAHSHSPKTSTDRLTVVSHIEDFLQQIQPDAEMGIFAIEQDPDLFGSKLSAIALTDGKHSSVVQNPSPALLQKINTILSRVSLVIAHDFKRLIHLTHMTFSAHVFDTMIASYLLHSGSRAHEIGETIQKELSRSVIIPASISKESDLKLAVSVVQVLPALAKQMKDRMRTQEVLHVFEDIEMPLIRILYEMETDGIGLDVKSLEKFSVQLRQTLVQLESDIMRHAGMSFNVNSPSQLADILFTTLALPTKGIKKTKQGYSTAASELEKLWDVHPMIPLIAQYRELAKLESTYVVALPKLVARDGRIHTTYNQTVAATGRLSSSDPNLQNIPIKTELGREIRKAFVASKGKTFVSADYSQIELRLVAELAQDEPFLRAFHEGADIHTRTASEVWGVKELEVTTVQRSAAKAINFGVLYGMGPRSLARSTGLSFAEAKHFIDRYFEIHASVKTYMDKTRAFAHANGFVQTYFGRRRYLPEIQSGVPMLVATAERMAINMPIQGTQADLVKMAMIAVDGWLKRSGLQARMLLQVHDEIVLEVDEADVPIVSRGVKELMEGIVTFHVPLKVDIEVGDNWGEMRKR